MALKNSGKMAHARWLTTANRMLWLYVATENPPNTMKSIVAYLIKVYVPTKLNTSSENGALNVFKTIEFSREMDETVLAMINDERNHIRELGRRGIRQVRTLYKGKSVRPFVIPALNFAVLNDIDIINWQDTIVTEPPLTQELSDEEINTFIQPCHNHAVERCVKLVTEA
ncbi:Hypothetical predicted protein [Octopus vulgaris]|uniref:Uncharacterized protein n=1 Tax=Octopus vulgaris TaxID=6645 RepID=A0AA36BWM0_OCTVU|nr:Hypothetical predicted protein [Octopus vulgaris]